MGKGGWVGLRVEVGDQAGEAGWGLGLLGLEAMK